MKIRKQLVSSRSKTWEGTNRCLSITVHETANTGRGANAAAHANLQTRGNVRQASWHYQVDDVEVVQSFPDDVQCWHAGWEARHSIAIEICVNADGDYDKALANAAALVRHLREKHGIGRRDVVQHNHWTGKNCPTKLRASGRWPEFVASTDPGNTSGGTMDISELLSTRLTTSSGQRGVVKRDDVPLSKALTDAATGGLWTWKNGPRLLTQVNTIAARLTALEKAINKGTGVSARDVARELEPLLADDIRQGISQAVANLPERDATTIAQAVASTLAARLAGTDED